MGFAEHYFSKQKRFAPCFTEPPSDELRYIVVIPAYCEPLLTDSLKSLWNCARPKGHVEVIVVVNSPEDASVEVRKINASSMESARDWISDHTEVQFRFRLMYIPDMPAKDAGVGLARKTGMDEALHRFSMVDNPGGIILSFDADSLCAVNYFTAVEETLEIRPKTRGFDIYFEHPVSGNEFPEKVYRGAVLYEMHLRYLNQFLRFSGFPFAYHTVGSCFGVRASVYAAQGGMNRRKAGEDFYFLHKIIPLGEFAEISGTCVFPSPRVSSRVPFGTGVTIRKFMESDEEDIVTYAPECFRLLQSFFTQINGFYQRPPETVETVISQLPQPLESYLTSIHAVSAISEINANSSSASAFANRFFRWFDAFRVVKFLNRTSSIYFPRIPVRNAVHSLLKLTGNITAQENLSDLELLIIIRKIEKGYDIRA